MDQASKLGASLTGPVSSDAIEMALTSDWRGLHAEADGDQTIARASVLTLVVAILEPSRVTPVLDAFAHLSDQHPSRTLVLLPNFPVGAAELQVWHGAGCERYLGDERLLCGEQIVIAGRGPSVRLLSSLADQLTLPDLPTFLWWVGDLSPADDTLFERLTELADRLIVDSSDFGALGASTARLYRLARRRHQPCAASDLNWARLTPWRDLVAQFFDSPTLRPYLSTVSDLTIDVDATSADGSPQALLLFAWLATRVGWQPDPAVPLRFARLGDEAWRGRLRDAAGRPIAVVVRPVPPTAGANGLRQVTLTVENGATFVVRREDDGTHALTEADVAGAPALRRMVRFESADLSSLVADELLLFRRDHIYEDALTFATGLTGGVSQWPGGSA